MAVTGTNWTCYDSSTMTSREIYGRTLAELAKADDRIVALTADLEKSTALNKFTEVFPNKVFNVGIAEQNLFGAAAGMGVRLLAPHGTFVKIGHHMCAITYDETPVWWQELNIVGIDAHGMETWEGRKLYTFDLVQEWMRDGKYFVKGFITNRFKLDDYKAALELAIRNPPDVVKIVLECQ